MLTFGSIVIGATDVRAVQKFWMSALDYAPHEESDDGTWAILLPRVGVGPQIVVTQNHSDPQDRPRVHLDLYADRQRVEVMRLTKLGATQVDEDANKHSAEYVVMADPDGNRFCVIEKSR